MRARAIDPPEIEARRHRMKAPGRSWRAAVGDATTPPMLLLWAYLLYFIVTMVYEGGKVEAGKVYANACPFSGVFFFFREDGLRAGIVAVVIGVALNASAMGPGETVAAYVRASPNRCVRFFVLLRRF